MIPLVIVLAIVMAVVTVLIAPIYASAMEERKGQDNLPSADVAELEADRDAKLREVRDAELDWRTGKLSEADWQNLDAELRVEASVILKKLDAAGVKKTEGL
ncbi:MAG: hypothetical protein NTX07_08290 [Solirubrobacterales bacterium]|nr:hypothetical protein [Solirubrobacterales bacterium]